MGLLFLASPAWGGVHYSGEAFAELPAQWRGFLPDQRLLRTLAAPAGPNQPANPLRAPYAEAAEALAARQPQLTADEAADLGALRLRLGQIDAALAVLRDAAAKHPDHFRIAANLGTAWQLQGDLDQAALALRAAVRLAPPRFRKAEELQLKLVQLRRAEPRASQGLDDLFGVNYQDDPAAIRSKLPADAVSTMQWLALWLPGDGRLLWQLGELAHVYGDVRTAAAILDGCVTEFGMSDPAIRRRRAEFRAEADNLAREKPLGKSDAQAAHAGGHGGGITFRSPRPLPRRLDAARLPPIRPEGLNPLPWSLLVETSLDRNFKPAFAQHLRDLDGRRVVLTGFMQPIGDDLETGLFLLMEYPVGCWFCEAPEPTGIVLIELPEGKSVRLTRDPIKIEGKLALNANDPEHFLYTIREAKVGAVD
jgi:hypothetical protein